MKSVILRGPVLTQSGYGVHSRQVARWLIELAEAQKIKLSIQCVPWGDTTWYLNPDDLDGLIGKIMKFSVAVEEKADISFQVILPNEWDLSCARYNVGITAGIETDRCNPQWIDAVNKMDLVVVPSTHIKNTFKNSGKLTREIVVIPESFPDALKQEPTGKFEFDTSFNFLIFGQLTSPNPSDDRKNIFKTMKVIADTFSENDDVGIVIKSNVGRSTIIDYKAIQGIITSACQHMKINKKIHLLHGSFTDSDLNNLYKTESIKATISLTRGEGFGLPLFEAAREGLPITTIGWSGQLDFLYHDGKDYFNKVDYSLQPIQQQAHWPGVLEKDSMWAYADQGSYKMVLRKTYKNLDKAKKIANDLKPLIESKFSNESLYENFCNSIYVDNTATDEEIDALFSSLAEEE